MEEVGKNRCTYCWRKWKPEELNRIPDDDSPHLNRKYCPDCFDRVYEDHKNLPWNKEKYRYKPNK